MNAFNCYLPYIKYVPCLLKNLLLTQIIRSNGEMELPVRLSEYPAWEVAIDDDRHVTVTSGSNRRRIKFVPDQFDVKGRRMRDRARAGTCFFLPKVLHQSFHHRTYFSSRFFLDFQPKPHDIDTCLPPTYFQHVSQKSRFRSPDFYKQTRERREAHGDG